MDLEYYIYEFITLCRLMKYSHTVSSQYVLDLHHQQLQDDKDHTIIKIDPAVNLYKKITLLDSELYNWELIRKWTQKIDDELRIYVSDISKIFQRYHTPNLIFELQNYCEKWDSIKMPYKRVRTNRNNACQLENILSQIENCLHEYKNA